MKHIKFYLLSTWINILIKFKRGGVGICFLHMQKIILKWKLVISSFSRITFQI